jgi:hypothetical protein
MSGGRFGEFSWYRWAGVSGITVCQYSETNVMHFLCSLLRIKGLYMFRAVLAHPQEVQPTVNALAIYQVSFFDRLLRMSK